MSVQGVSGGNRPGGSDNCSKHAVRGGFEDGNDDGDGPDLGSCSKSAGVGGSLGGSDEREEDRAAERSDRQERSHGEAYRASDRMERETDTLTRAEAMRSAVDPADDPDTKDRPAGRLDGVAGTRSRDAGADAPSASAAERPAEAADRAQRSASLERMRAECEAARARVMREAAPMSLSEATRFTSRVETAPLDPHGTPVAQAASMMPASFPGTGMVTLSAGTLGEIALQQVRSGAQSLLDDLGRLGALGKSAARVGPGALPLALTPSPLGGEVVHPLGPDLRFRGAGPEVWGEIERRVDGLWQGTGVMAERTLEGGLAFDGGALARALADPLPGVAGFPDQSELLRELGRNGGFTPASPLPNVLSTPMPSDTLPNFVTMADPNDSRAIAAQDRARQHLSQAFPEAVIVTNREYRSANGQVIGEIDLTVDGIPIEVTAGRGKGKSEQASRIEALTGTAPVVYGERLSPTVERNLRDNGVSVATSLEELEAILRDLRGAE
jgi:hypothetical protein